MFSWEGIKKSLIGDGEGEASLSRFMKKRQLIVLMLLVLAIIGAVVILSKLSDNPDKTVHIVHKKKKVALVDGVRLTDFDKKNERSALEMQQAEVRSLQRKIVDTEKRLTNLLKRSAKKIHVNSEKLKNITSLYGARSTVAHRADKERAEPWARDVKNPPTKIMMPGAMTARQIRQPTQIQAIRFHYDAVEPKTTHKKGSSRAICIRRYGSCGIFRRTPKNYVPAGTFARVVLLEGADANASVNAQSDTSGILLRILDHGTLPNGHRSHLKGCFVLASIYGDISSERGEARLTTISCTRHDGSIFEKKVQGYLSFAGKEGIKGTPVMRNGKILAMAGISGMLSGVGSALQDAAQTQAVSPLGATSIVNPNKVWQNAGFGGASTAMDHLAGYYVKRADQYHPIIEIGSGTLATVIFQRGFSLLDKDEEKTIKERIKSASVKMKQVSKSSADEVRRLLKQAQQISKKTNNAPFSRVN